MIKDRAILGKIKDAYIKDGRDGLPGIAEVIATALNQYGASGYRLAGVYGVAADEVSGRLKAAHPYADDRYNESHLTFSILAVRILQLVQAATGNKSIKAGDIFPKVNSQNGPEDLSQKWGRIMYSRCFRSVFKGGEKSRRLLSLHDWVHEGLAPLSPNMSLGIIDRDLISDPIISAMRDVFKKPYSAYEPHWSLLEKKGVLLPSQPHHALRCLVPAATGGGMG